MTFRFPSARSPGKVRRRLLGRARLAPLAVLATLAVVLMVLAVNAARVAADVVHLQDGTTIEGEVKKIGSTYQIKTVDGQYKFIPESKVAKIDGAGGATGANVPKAGSGGGSSPATGAGGFTNDYWTLKTRTDRMDEPVRAVTLWERHLARKDLSAAEREQAERDLKFWKDLYTNDAEKVKGKWMSGADLKDLKKQADDLIEEGLDLEQNQHNILDAVRNYQKAVRIYPNSFIAHFRLGYLELKQSYGAGGNVHARAAKRSLIAALQLQPENPAVLSNYGACMAALGDPQQAVKYLWKATQKAETPTIVGNLLNVLNSLPRRYFNSSAEMREINLRANSLRERYQPGQLLYITDPRHGLDQQSEGDDEDKGPPGLRGNGSGFFITADGFLLTNRHVAKTDDGYYYRVRLAEKDAEGNYVEYLCKFIAADDKYDVALLKAELPEGKTVPFLKILENDFPPQLDDVVTFGYPTVGTGQFLLQTSRGVVTTTQTAEAGDYDVLLDIKTTQGNSGGPIVDKDGVVIGIISAYRKVYDSIVSMAIGPRQMRDFLSGVDGAPSLKFAPQGNGAFDAQALVQDVKPKTLLVLIFRGNIDDAGDDAGGSADDSKDAPAPDGPDGKDGSGGLGGKGGMGE